MPTPKTPNTPNREDLAHLPPPSYALGPSRNKERRLSLNRFFRAAGPRAVGSPGFRVTSLGQLRDSASYGDCYFQQSQSPSPSVPAGVHGIVAISRFLVHLALRGGTRDPRPPGLRHWRSLHAPAVWQAWCLLPANTGFVGFRILFVPECWPGGQGPSARNPRQCSRTQGKIVEVASPHSRGKLRETRLALPANRLS